MIVQRDSYYLGCSFGCNFNFFFFTFSHWLSARDLDGKKIRVIRVKFGSKFFLSLPRPSSVRTWKKKLIRRLSFCSLHGIPRINRSLLSLIFNSQTTSLSSLQNRDNDFTIFFSAGLFIASYVQHLREGKKNCPKNF